MVYNTLLELYLGEIGSCAPSERVTKERKALELLKRPEVHLGEEGGGRRGRERGTDEGSGRKERGGGEGRRRGKEEREAGSR